MKLYKTKYCGKKWDVGDITYILKDYSDGIPEKVVSDILWKLYEYVPVGHDHVNPVVSE